MADPSPMVTSTSERKPVKPLTSTLEVGTLLPYLVVPSSSHSPISGLSLPPAENAWAFNFPLANGNRENRMQWKATGPRENLAGDCVLFPILHKCPQVRVCPCRKVGKERFRD